MTQQTDNSEKFIEILTSAASRVCVLAGPGSGKTKGILIPKAKDIVADLSVDPREVLILSFSRLSALDLKKKIIEMERAPKALTLHALCLSFLLSEDNHDIRDRINSVILDFEKDALISDLKVKLTRIDKRQIRKMLNEFSAGWAINPHDQVFTESEEKQEFKRTLLRWLEEHKASMMEEIVYYAVDLAKKIDSDFINGYKYIFIDEYQDLNKLEQEFVEILAKDSELLLVVGDPDQSIYSFKYAHPEGIGQFASDPSTEDHSLPFTGRCAKNILKIANQVLLQSDPQRKDLLKPISSQIDGIAQLKRFNTQEEEYDFVVDSISQKVESGIKPEEIIVLVPRKKLGSDFVKYATEKSQSTDYVFASKNEFSPIEQEKILLFSILVNPQSALHIRSYLGLGDENNYAQEIEEVKNKYGCDTLGLLSAVNSTDFSARRTRMHLLCAKIEQLNSFISEHQNYDNTSELIDDLFPENSGELSSLRNIILSLAENGDSINDIYFKLIDYARNANIPDDKIRVMTLIASKGLEAEYVYIIGCNDGNIPGANRSDYLNDSKYKEEQRRLLYVGITRAKKELLISWSRNIPFGQAMNQATSIIRTVTINGKCYSQVGISEFIQDLDFS
ncbi:MAG: ATP-dependent helicase [Candidatus Berkelbacteria bacterium]